MANRWDFTLTEKIYLLFLTEMILYYALCIAWPKQAVKQTVESLVIWDA